MRPPPFSLQTGLSLAVIALCVAVLTCYLWPIHGVIFQIYALAALFLALRYCPPVARWLERMPGPHRAVLILLIAGVVAGHFTLSTRKYYPFIAWDIFAAVSEKDPVFCRELIGTTADGKSVRLRVEQLFPSIVQFDLPPADQPEKMDTLVHALAKAYNERHTSNPLRQVDLMLMAVELHPPPGESRDQPSCELLQHYDVSSAR